MLVVSFSLALLFLFAGWSTYVFGDSESVASSLFVLCIFFNLISIGALVFDT